MASNEGLPVPSVLPSQMVLSPRQLSVKENQ